MCPHARKSPLPFSSLRLLAPYFRRYRLQVAGGILSLVVVDILQLFIPRVIKRAVDALEAGTATPNLLLSLGGVIVALAVVIGALRFAWRYLLLGFSRLVEMHLRNRMFGHILTLDRTFFARSTTGDIMALSTNDLTNIQLSTGMGVVAALDATVMTAAAFVFMVLIEPRLTLIALAPMPILALLARILTGRLHGRFTRVQEQFSHLTEFARATIANIRLIKAYTQEAPQAARFDALGQDYVRDNIRLAVVQGILFPVSGLVANASLLLVLLFGGAMTIKGHITAGDFVAFIAYLFMFAWPMMAIGWVANLFQRGLSSLARIEGLLSARPALSDPPAAGPLPPVCGGLSVRGLTFAYPGAGAPALRDVSLEIAPGVLGIVGRTGAGKSTLCHLLARLYPVPPGSILCDGRPVEDFPLSHIRSAVAYVPQDVTVFSDTVAFNIALGNPKATPAEIERAARAAAIHDEIAAMPEGYGTRIGEKGVKLSGGQRQRLAIARALLLDRPILILDDALSAVDTETERTILSALAAHMRGRSCVVVSHRVAALAEAGEIVVMEGGRVVARGTKAALMEHNEFFKTIARRQAAPSEATTP